MNCDVQDNAACKDLEDPPQLPAANTTGFEEKKLH